MTLVRFRLKSQVVFGDLIKKKGSSFPLEDTALRRKLTELHNGVVVVLLRHKASGRLVVLGNMQLFWKPDFPHVKAVQAQLACMAVTSFRDRQAAKLRAGGEGIVGSGEDGKIAIVLCGDLNSVRDMQLEYLPSFQREALEEAIEGAEEGQGFAPPGHERSGVFQLLREGVLEQAHPQHPDSFKRANAPKPWSQMTPEEKKRMRL